MSENKNRRKGASDRIFWGIILILSAALIILDSTNVGLGVFAGVSIVKIILGILCFAWTVSEAIKLKISHIFFPLSFIFMLFQEEIAKAIGNTNEKIMSNWLVLLCALLLTVGTALIFKPKKEIGGSNNNEKSKHFIGNYARYIDISENDYFFVDNNMGKTEVFFSNIDAYLGNATLEIENNMGNTVVYIPDGINAYCNIENSLGSVIVPNDTREGKTLNITGKNSLGNVEIKYV